MFKVAKKILVLTLCATVVFPLMGCSSSGMGFTGEQVMRKFTPRFMRDQIFSNNPTAYNQQRFREVDSEEVLRKLRNGTKAFGEEFRLIAKNRMQAQEVTGYEEMTEDSYGKGYQDGCKTYMSVVGNGMYRFNDAQFDADRMLNDSWYLRGFQDASSFCTFRKDWEIH